MNNPEFTVRFRKGDFGLARLIDLGNLIVHEQQRVQNMRLAQEYVTVPTKSNEELRQRSLNLHLLISQ